MTTTEYPPPLFRDWEAWMIIVMITLISLVTFPPWLSAKCAGEWRCEIGGPK